MKNKIIIWTASVAVLLIVNVLMLSSPKAQSQEKRAQTVQPATAFLWVAAGVGDSLVVGYSSCSMTNLQFRYGDSLAGACQSLRDAGFRIVQSEGNLIRLESP